MTTPELLKIVANRGLKIILRDGQPMIVKPDGNQAVSGKHARIDLTPDGAFLRDLESTNGTFVNDRRIERRELLYDGDRIRIGDTLFTFKKT